jgi:tetratricopeptide (TPR) repeat protein
VANIRAGQAWVAARAPLDENAARICAVYPSQGVEAPKRRLPPDEWVRWLESALEAAQRLGERVLAGDHLGNLGVAWFDRGDNTRAIDYLAAALDIIRDTPERHGEAAALDNLGAAYLRLGDSRRAIDYLMEALPLHRQAGNARGEGRVLVNLVAAHLARNEMLSARACGEQAQRALSASGDGEALAGLAGNMGQGYLQQGDTARALASFREQREIASRIGYRLGEATAHWNLAMAHERLGERAAARAALQAALTLYEALDDSGAADARQKLAEWGGEGQ